MSRFRWEVYIAGELQRDTVVAATPFGAGACAVLQWPNKCRRAERNRKSVRVKPVSEIKDR